MNDRDFQSLSSFNPRIHGACCQPRLYSPLTLTCSPRESVPNTLRSSSPSSRAPSPPRTRSQRPLPTLTYRGILHIEADRPSRNGPTTTTRSSRIGNTWARYGTLKIRRHRPLSGAVRPVTTTGRTRKSPADCTSSGSTHQQRRRPTRTESRQVRFTTKVAANRRAPGGSQVEGDHEGLGFWQLRAVLETDGRDCDVECLSRRKHLSRGSR